MRKFLKKTISLALSLSMLGGIMGNEAFAQDESAADESECTRIEQILASMTTEQKIAQKIMPELRGWMVEGDTAIKNVTELNPEIETFIRDYGFGGIILFGENVVGTEQSFKLTTQFQQAALQSEQKIPMLLGIDQEGGIVYRLGSGTALPGNMALGAINNPNIAREAGRIIGRELNALGINVNFAPSVDVNNNPKNTVIGLRAFSDDPQMVHELAVPMIAGMNDYNVASAAKHFPGHGNTATDSHYGLPVVDKSLEELKACELIPFQAAVDAGVDMIMTAHIMLPQIDANFPATLSPTILNDILRKDMGYEGVIITDGFYMQGIVSVEPDASKRVIKAFQASVDIALMPTNMTTLAGAKADVDRMIDTVKQAIAEGTYTEEELDASVLRILKLKEDRGILDAAYPVVGSDAYAVGLQNALATVGSNENRDMERNIAAAAITVVENKNNILPLRPEKDAHVFLMAPYANEQPGLALGMLRVIADGTVDEGVTYETYRYASDTTLVSIQEKIDAADYVIVVSETASGTDAADWRRSIPKSVTDYVKGKSIPAIVMSVSQPYDVADYPNADAVLAAYGAKGMDPTEGLRPDKAFGPNITAGVEVMFGNYAATGKLPLDIPVMNNGVMNTNEIAYERGYGLTYDKVSHSSD